MWRAGTAGRAGTAERFIIILMILCFAVVSFVSVVSVVSTQTFTKPHYPNFLQEGRFQLDWKQNPISCQKGSDLFYRKRRSPRDSTLSTALGGLNFWDVPQIAAYSEKLFLVRRGQMQRLLGVRPNFLPEGVRCNDY